MKRIEIKQEDMLEAVANIPEHTPLYMLNLLRYKERAEYAEGEDFEPCSGQEAYFKRYIPIFVELAAAYPEIKPFWFGQAIAGLVLAEGEKWDNVALISYPDFDSFKTIVESDDYKTKALPHRLAALDDFKLVVSVEVSPV